MNSDLGSLSEIAIEVTFLFTDQTLFSKEKVQTELSNADLLLLSSHQKNWKKSMEVSWYKPIGNSMFLRLLCLIRATQSRCASWTVFRIREIASFKPGVTEDKHFPSFGVSFYYSKNKIKSNFILRQVYQKSPTSQCHGKLSHAENSLMNRKRQILCDCFILQKDRCGRERNLKVMLRWSQGAREPDIVLQYLLFRGHSFPKPKTWGSIPLKAIYKPLRASPKPTTCTVVQLRARAK